MAVVGGTVSVAVAVGPAVASGGSVPLGYTIAMMSAASFSAAAVILSTSTGLLICCFMGLMDGLWYVLNLTCSLKMLSCIIMAMLSSILFEIFLPLNSCLVMLRCSSAMPLLTL